MKQARARRKRRLLGLVLSGGGARGAYEAGVLRTLLPALAQRGVGIDFISGTSVGAVNACALAASAHLCETVEQARKRADYVTAIWSLVRQKDVFRFNLHKSVPLFYLDVLNVRGPHPARLLDGGVPLASRIKQAAAFRKYRFSGLLDTEPLKRELADSGVMNWPKISDNVQTGKLKGLALSATSIRSGMVVVFVQSPLISAPLVYQKDRMVLWPVRTTVEHALASCAMPFLFPPVEMRLEGGEKELFIDGAIRQNSPLLPLVILGAESLIVLGVQSTKAAPVPREVSPSEIAPLLGKILNSFFLDPVRIHYGHFVTINELIGAASRSSLQLINSRRLLDGRPMLREIRSVGIFPSEDIGAMAAEHWRKARPKIPSAWRLVLDSTILKGQAYGDFLSYFYFDYDFLSRLMKLGEEDGMRVSPQMLDYLAGMD